MKWSLCLCLFLTVLAPDLGYSRTIVGVTVKNGYKLSGDGWLGRTDGFVTVRVGRSHGQTRTIWNNNNPNWQQSWRFLEPASSSYLTLSVWDRDGGWFGPRNQYLGGCSLWTRRGSHSRSCRIGGGWVFFSYYSYRFSRDAIQATTQFPVTNTTLAPV